VKVENLAPRWSKAIVEEERPAPFAQRSAYIPMPLQAIANVPLMLHVKPEGITNAYLQKHAAQSQISALIAEKARTLLDCVGIPDPHIAGHVSYCQALDREAAIHSLAADKNQG